MAQTFDIYHDLIIKASKKEVFDAVSLPEHLNNWWTLKCLGVRELGAEYNLYFGPEYNWFGKVSALELNSSFHIKMTKTMKHWEPTIFGFDLEDAAKGVRLKFSHRNWAQRNDEFRHSSFCWALLLNGLKNYLEKGVVVPFEDRA